MGSSKGHCHPRASSTKTRGFHTQLDKVNNFRYADDTTLMAESEEELKSLLMKVKVESEKVGLKLNIQKMKIMQSYKQACSGPGPELLRLPNSRAPVATPSTSLGLNGTRRPEGAAGRLLSWHHLTPHRAAAVTATHTVFSHSRNRH